MLNAGTRLGAYEIQRLLGAGGMGEVYVAIDTRLGRQVAVKVLAEHEATDAGRRERLDREARAISRLNHPNICTLHDIGEAITEGRSVTYLVMELIEGESLTSAMPQKGFPLDRVLALARQIVDALIAAHAAGIVHRDLKPANILVTADGRVKVLDFGLAKWHSANPDAALTQTDTGPHVVLGTAAYMSPEQANGAAIDQRSDLFSFGTILYELATGSRPFTGDSSVAVLSSVLKDTPAPVTDVKADLPSDFGRIVRRALAKDPDARYQTAKDLRNDLLELADTTNARPAKVPAKKWAVYAAAGVAMAMLIAAGMFLTTREQPSQPVQAAPAGVRMTRLTTTGDAEYPAISKDGKFVAYRRRTSEGESIWLHHIAAKTDTQLVAPSKNRRLYGMAISPDGAFVDFSAAERAPSLWRVPLTGGMPRLLVDVAFTAPGWSPNGDLMAYIRHAGENLEQSHLVVARGDGTEPRVVATKRTPHSFASGSYANADFRPVWLSQNRLAVFSVSSVPGGAFRSVSIIDVATGAEIEALTVDSPPLTLGNGMALSSDNSSLLFVLPKRNAGTQVMRLTAPSGLAAVTDDLNDYSGMTVAGDVVATARRDVRNSVWIGDGSGGDMRRLGEPAIGGEGSLSWAGNERLLVHARTPSGTGTWAINLAGQAQLIADAGRQPDSTPDGSTVFFSRLLNGQGQRWRAGPDGRGATPVPGVGSSPSAITPDGRTLFFTTVDERNQSLRAMTLPDGPPRLVLDSVTVFFPTISPDGKSLVFGTSVQTSDSRRPEAWVWSIEANRATHRIELPRPTTPRWNADGTGIAFIQGPNVWTQSLDGGKPHQVTQFDDQRILDFRWSPDGKRLAVSRTQETNDIVLIHGVK